MPTVSVITAAYNRPKYLSEAIESVLAQTCGDWELIIVNDGSTNETPAVIERYAAHDARIRVISQPNQGLAKARNNGIAAARGRYVAFLDDDDVWRPKKLAKQVAWCDANPQAGLCFSQAVLTDAALNPLRVFPDSWPSTFEELATRNRIPLPTVMVRRECLECVGGFDETLRRSTDYDLWLRITRRYAFGCLPEPLALYRRHGQNMSLEPAGRHYACLAIFRKQLRDPRPPRPVRLLRLRLAQQYYALGRLERDRAAHLLAAVRFAQAIGTWPSVGLRPPSKAAPVGHPVFRAIKPYLAVAVCLGAGVVGWLSRPFGGAAEAVQHHG